MKAVELRGRYDVQQQDIKCEITDHFFDSHMFQDAIDIPLSNLMTELPNPASDIDNQNHAPDYKDVQQEFDNAKKHGIDTNKLKQDTLTASIDILGGSLTKSNINNILRRLKADGALSRDDVQRIQEHPTKFTDIDKTENLLDMLCRKANTANVIFLDALYSESPDLYRQVRKLQQEKVEEIGAICEIPEGAGKKGIPEVDMPISKQRIKTDEFPTTDPDQRIRAASEIESFDKPETPTTDPDQRMRAASEIESLDKPETIESFKDLAKRKLDDDDPHVLIKSEQEILVQRNDQSKMNLQEGNLSQAKTGARCEIQEGSHRKDISAVDVSMSIQENTIHNFPATDPDQRMIATSEIESLDKPETIEPFKDLAIRKLDDNDAHVLIAPQQEMLLPRNAQRKKDLQEENLSHPVIGVTCELPEDARRKDVPAVDVSMSIQENTIDDFLAIDHDHLMIAADEIKSLDKPATITLPQPVASSKDLDIRKHDDEDTNDLLKSQQESQHSVSQKWKLIQEFGMKGDGPGQFKKANGIAVCNNGDIVVTDHRTTTTKAYLFNSNGKYQFTFQSHLTNPNGKLLYPMRVAVTGGDVLISDTSKLVKIFDVSGDYLKSLSTAAPECDSTTKYCTYGIAVTPSGGVCAGDIKRRVVTLRNTMNEQQVKIMPISIQPYHLACDRDNNVWASDCFVSKVIRLSGNGDVMCCIDSFKVDGKTGAPYGVVCDEDLLYIAVKEINEMHQHIPNTGHIHQYSIGGQYLGCIITHMNAPCGIAISNGKLFVANSKSILVYGMDIPGVDVSMSIPENNIDDFSAVASDQLMIAAGEVDPHSVESINDLGTRKPDDEDAHVLFKQETLLQDNRSDQSKQEFQGESPLLPEIGAKYEIPECTRKKDIPELDVSMSIQENTVIDPDHRMTADGEIESFDKPVTITVPHSVESFKDLDFRKLGVEKQETLLQNNRSDQSKKDFQEENLLLPEIGARYEIPEGARMKDNPEVDVPMSIQENTSIDPDHRMTVDGEIESVDKPVTITVPHSVERFKDLDFRKLGDEKQKTLLQNNRSDQSKKDFQEENLLLPEIGARYEIPEGAPMRDMSEVDVPMSIQENTSIDPDHRMTADGEIESLDKPVTITAAHPVESFKDLDDDDAHDLFKSQQESQHSVSQKWKLIQEFGMEGDGPGQFKKANGIAVCNNGDIVVTDHRATTTKAYLFNSNGKYQFTFQSHLTNPNGKLLYPMRVAVTGGDILISDTSKLVKIFDFSGDYLNSLSTAAAECDSTTKYCTYGIAVTPSGVVGAGDIKRRVVTLRNTTDEQLVKMVPISIQPYHLACDRDNNVWASDCFASKVIRLSGNGDVTCCIDSFKVDGKTGAPYGVVCNEDLVYIAVKEINEMHQHIPNTGHIHRYTIGGQYLGCIIRHMNAPCGIAISNGKLFVANSKSVLVYEQV
ncbi:uncharacterized protein [Amphiura filiformis]|uniref:uncharacterized protein isoform X2 n=1 Tax=Amphiura filiformis TaxID=82378 RepID=UPI003B20F8A8